MVNPVIEPVGPETMPIIEGCLSVPDLRGELERFAAIRVSYLDREGTPRESTFESLSAGTFQHEVDHLDGILFLDRVTDPRTFMTWEEFDRRHRDAWLERIGLS
jgi:peptide deformylase